MDILEKLHVTPRLDTPLVVQLKEQLTWLIASGQIQPGELLPSVRRMAEHLSINLHTVRSAYQRLEAQGLVETRQGVGTRALPYDPIRLMQLGSAVPSHMLGVIIPDLNNPLYTQYIRGVESVTRQVHTLLLVCDAHEEPDEALVYTRKLAEKSVDGILVFSFSISEYLPAGALKGDTSQSIPFVTIDWPEKTGYNVLCDLQDGACQAAQHLIADGHRRIGLIAFAMDIPSVQEIRAGYARALSDAGIPVDESLAAHVYGFDDKAGEEGARALLRLPDPPRAIFAMSDLLATGALRAIRAANLRVPQDIAIAGINDIPLAGLVDPPLTTVHQPAYEMGQQAMRMLQNLIGGRPPPERQVILPMSLVVRQSCGCGRSAA